MLIRVIKLSEAPDTEPPAPASNAWAPNSERALPVDYTVESWLAKLIELGSSIVLLGIARNGIVRPGIFTSTEVKEIRVVSRNSVYRVEIAADDAAPQAFGSQPSQS